jgi:hypothetical protein
MLQKRHHYLHNSYRMFSYPTMQKANRQQGRYEGCKHALQNDCTKIIHLYRYIAPVFLEDVK